jgi:hypothetical protein
MAQGGTSGAVNRIINSYSASAFRPNSICLLLLDDIASTGENHGVLTVKEAQATFHTRPFCSKRKTSAAFQSYTLSNR